MVVRQEQAGGFATVKLGQHRDGRQRTQVPTIYPLICRNSQAVCSLPHRQLPPRSAHWMFRSFIE